MLKKFNLFFCLTITFSIISFNAISYDVIREEDQELLKDIFETSADSKTTISISKTSAPTPSLTPTIIPSQDNLDTTSNNTSKNQVQPTTLLSQEFEETDNNITQNNDDDTSSITPPAPNAFANQDELPPLRSIMYPTKEERAKNRQEEREWFNPRVNAPIMPDTMSAKDALDPYLEDIKDDIHYCLSERQDKLNVEQSLLTSGNLYSNSAYISQTFTDINTCYENVALNIISTYYDNDPRVLNEFKQKAPTFYITGTSPSFDVNLCGETCSMEAIVKSQIEKFKEYRTYLSELLANRPQAKRKLQ